MFPEVTINIKLLKTGGVTAIKFGSETWTKGQMRVWTNTPFTLDKNFHIHWYRKCGSFSMLQLLVPK
jgi:hypothetical protein